MMRRLEVMLVDRMVGWLEFEPSSTRFSFAYADDWVNARDSFPLCPSLPLQRPAAESSETHSALVRQFFENLLPEGQALDDAAATHKVSRSNPFALLEKLGRECIGALRIIEEGEAATQAKKSPRLLSPDELSSRIRERPYMPFTVWDARIRLSIPGFQDKLAVYRENDDWYLADGVQHASTHILKPERHDGPLDGMTYNEFACMRLAAKTGISVAEVRLVHVPEPVLEVRRFDREWIAPGQVRRIHALDGCQALGLPPAMKYERPGGRDLEGIRDGASFKKLFEVVAAHSINRVADSIALLRWTAFQILMNNTDAHAKNVTFFCTTSGLRLAPAYDILCCGAFERPLDDSYAMAIGDAFLPAQLSAFEWASFGHQCGLPLPLVGQELGRVSKSLLAGLDAVLDETAILGGAPRLLQRMRELIGSECEKQASLASSIRTIDVRLL